MTTNIVARTTADNATLSPNQEVDISLSLDKAVFSPPGGSEAEDVIDPNVPVAWTTVGTTCWSCTFSCSCDNSECFC